VQTCLNQRMVEGSVLPATGHKREPGEICEHRSFPILTVEPEERAFLRKGVDSQMSTNSRQSLAQFLPILPVASVPETAEPVIAMGLSNRCARPDHFPTLASPVARSTHLVQSAKGWGKSSVWGKARCRAASRVPSIPQT
jgi:hypothetical protein